MDFVLASIGGNRHATNMVVLNESAPGVERIKWAVDQILEPIDSGGGRGCYLVGMEKKVSNE